MSGCDAARALVVGRSVQNQRSTEATEARPLVGIILAPVILL